MGKLANLAASRGIILPDETALRLSIRAELKNHEMPPPKIRLRHYRAVDQNEMDHLSDTIRENLSLEYPPDLVNSLVKQVITMDETAARASAKAAAKREVRMAQLDLKRELETATVESGDRISLEKDAVQLSTAKATYQGAKTQILTPETTDIQKLKAAEENDKCRIERIGAENDVESKARQNALMERTLEVRLEIALIQLAREKKGMSVESSVGGGGGGASGASVAAVDVDVGGGDREAGEGSIVDGEI